MTAKLETDPKKPPTAELRIAVVGAGLIGRRHIERIVASQNCTLAAVVDAAPAAQEIAARAASPYFKTLEALLSDMSPDGIILATPNKVHVEQGIICLEANITTLIEKPVADNLQDGLKLQEAAKQSTATVLVGHHRAHSPIMREAQALVRGGTLGNLVAVTGSAMFYKPDDYFEAAPWRTQVGGGPMLINLIHDIHNLRMLCGEIDAVQAFASSKARGFPVEDTVAISLRFASGVLGTFLLSDTAAAARSWEQTAREDSSYPSYPDEDCYLIAGTRGSLAIPTMRLKTYSNEQSWWQPFSSSQLNVARVDPLAEQLEHFCEVIRGNTDPLVSLYDGLQNIRVVEAIVKAANTGGVVRLAS